MSCNPLLSGLVPQLKYAREGKNRTMLPFSFRAFWLTIWRLHRTLSGRCCFHFAIRPVSYRSNRDINIRSDIWTAKKKWSREIPQDFSRPFSFSSRTTEWVTERLLVVYLKRYSKREWMYTEGDRYLIRRRTQEAHCMTFADSRLQTTNIHLGKNSELVKGWLTWISLKLAWIAVSSR